MNELQNIGKLTLALDYCASSRCKLCPYMKCGAQCHRFLNSDASKLIKAMLYYMEPSKIVAPADIYSGKRIAERLDEGCAHWRKNLSEAASFITRHRHYAELVVLHDRVSTSKAYDLSYTVDFDVPYKDGDRIPITYDIKPIRKEDMIDAMAYSSWITEIMKTVEGNEQKKWYRQAYEHHFTPKSIEQSADHKTVCVLWQDGTKTIVKLSENDKDDIDTAFAYALAKKIFGTNTHLKKVVREKLNVHKPKNKKED